MHRRLQHIKTCLLVHFIESPSTTHPMTVQILARGFTLSIWERKDGSFGCETQGQATEDHIKKLSRADDLAKGQVVELLEQADPILAAAVEVCEEKHPIRPRMRTHERTYRSGDHD